jgi:glycosyltransferase involved in cell wall biosynthesis
MKITFVLPMFTVNGGNKVVSIYADKLARLGHEITVVSAIKKVTLKQQVKSLIKERRFHKPSIDSSLFDNLPNVKLLIRHVNGNGLINAQIPDADIIIATWWETVYFIENLSISKGKAFYLIQGHEIFPYLPVELVKETYKKNIELITVSSWLKNTIYNDYSRTSTLITNGVDIETFLQKIRNKSTKLRVGLLYTSVAIKNCNRAIYAFNKAKALLPDIKLIGFGTKNYEDALAANPFDEFYLNPQQSDIPSIYSSVDVWLFSSDSEGFGLPILEAMASGTPVIATPAGAAGDLLCDGGGVLLKEFSEEEMAREIINMNTLSNDAWLTLSNEAREIAERHSWDESAKKLEEILNVTTGSTISGNVN